MLSQGTTVDDGGTNGILEMSCCTICRVRVDRFSAEFFWSVSSLGSLVEYYVGDGYRG